MTFAVVLPPRVLTLTVGATPTPCPAIAALARKDFVVCVDDNAVARFISPFNLSVNVNGIPRNEGIVDFTIRYGSVRLQPLAIAFGLDFRFIVIRVSYTGLRRARDFIDADRNPDTGPLACYVQRADIVRNDVITCRDDTDIATSDVCAVANMSRHVIINVLTATLQTQSAIHCLPARSQRRLDSYL